MKSLPLIHAGATLFMAGLIWFVQVVHYPLFGAVGQGSFPAYEARHQRLTTWVVGPPMLLELAAAVMLLVFRPPNVPAWMLWAGLVMLGGIWLSTAFLQVPMHNRLAGGFDPSAHYWLVAGNWVRTALWSVRGVLALWVCSRAPG